jgi:hypothetical protein
MRNKQKWQTARVNGSTHRLLQAVLLVDSLLPPTQQQLTPQAPQTALRQRQQRSQQSRLPLSPG